MRRNSKVLRSHVPSILRLVPARLAAVVTGTPRDEIKVLKTDNRVMPPLRLIERLCLRFAVKPTQIISLDPVGTLRDVAPNWFRDGSERAKVAICGMGNVGHAMAGMLAARSDVSVRILVSSENRADEVRNNIESQGGLRVVGGGPDIVGRPAFVSHVAEKAVGDADLVILCAPAHVHLPLLHLVVPSMRQGSHLTCVPAAGGFNWKAQAVLRETGKDVGIFGIGGVPWMCKLQGKGATVRISNAKKINALQPLRAADSVFVTDVASLLLGMPVIDMATFLNINLAPANQLLHPGILYSLFKDWTGEPLPDAPLFYESLSEEGAGVLQALDNELLATARAIHAHVPDYWMSAAVSLHMGIRIGYEGQIGDQSTLRRAIVTNRAYQGIRTPMRSTPEGLVPDFGSRFLVEDIPHGMAILKGVAEIVGVETPMLDRVMSWCQQKMGKEYLVDGRLCGRNVGETAAPQVFGIADPATLVASCLPAAAVPTH